jgi:single-strand DNA-binding protein
MSIGETYVTVQGWVGSNPDLKEIGGQTPVTSFRIGSTPRQYDRGTGMYVAKPTTWFTVECWRALAQNAFDSVHLGQPVIVTGRLRTHEWTDEAGVSRSRVVLEAFSLGHDLTRGTTTFTKTRPRPATASETTTSESAGALGVVPSAGLAEATAPIPLTPTTQESEAA